MQLIELEKFSLHFNGNFPGGPGLASTWMSPFWTLLELRMMEVVSGDNWSYKTCKAPVMSSPPIKQHPGFFLQAGCPSRHPTNSVRHWRKKYHISWTWSPQTHLRSSVLSLRCETSDFFCFTRTTERFLWLVHWQEAWRPSTPAASKSLQCPEMRMAYSKRTLVVYCFCICWKVSRCEMVSIFSHARFLLSMFFIHCICIRATLTAFVGFVFSHYVS